MTRIHSIAYIVCDWSSTIHMYTADTLSPLGERIHVEGMTDPCDIVACRHDRQLYIADWKSCIWRVSADDHTYVKWLTTKSTVDTFSVNMLSLTSRRLLVTSRQPAGLHQYSTTDRQLLRVVPLPGYVEAMGNAVETTRQTFVIGYQGTSQDKKQFMVSELFLFMSVGYTFKAGG